MSIIDAHDAPPPITPASSAAQHDSRVAFESQVNAAVEEFVAAARTSVTETFLAGGTVELVHHVPGEDIAAETAYAAAADAGLTPYGEWSKSELVEEATNRGLAHSGTVAELIDRLEADDAADAAEADLVPKS